MFSPGRYEVLKYVFAGLQQSGLLLVEYVDGVFAPIFTPRPTGSVDDIGLFIIVPKIAEFFQTNLDQALSIFFYSSALLFFGIGIGAITLLYKRSGLQLFLGLVSVTSAFLFAWSTTRDVQLMYSLSIIAFLPLYIFCLKKYGQSCILYFVFLSVGFCFGCINYVRMHATLGLAIWMLSSLWLSSSEEQSLVRKILLSITFFCGIWIPSMYVGHIQKLSDQFLRKHTVNYQPTAQIHPFWHTIYAGFGFSHFLNKRDLAIADEIAQKEAVDRHGSNIDFSHPRYDVYLKDAVLEICKDDPAFVLSSFAIKMGILIYYILRYANIALLALFFNFSFKKMIPMLLGLCAYMLIPLLYIPCGPYSLGFVTFLQISGMIVINDFFQNTTFPKQHRLVILYFSMFYSLLNSGMIKSFFPFV